MPDHISPSFMHLTYVATGGAFLAAVCAALTWLSLARFRRGAAASTLRGSEFVWTLVPALLVVGLTVLGEIPRGWGKFVAAPQHVEVPSRAIR